MLRFAAADVLSFVCCVALWVHAGGRCRISDDGSDGGGQRLAGGGLPCVCCPPQSAGGSAKVPAGGSSQSIPVVVSHGQHSIGIGSLESIMPKSTLDVQSQCALMSISWGFVFYSDLTGGGNREAASSFFRYEIHHLQHKVHHFQCKITCNAPAQGPISMETSARYCWKHTHKTV